MNLQDRPVISFLGAVLRGVIGREKYEKSEKSREPGNREAAAGGGPPRGAAPEETADAVEEGDKTGKGGESL